jgi:hypothetical protein
VPYEERRQPDTPRLALGLDRIGEGVGPAMEGSPLVRTPAIVGGEAVGEGETERERSGGVMHLVVLRASDWLSVREPRSR